MYSVNLNPFLPKSIGKIHHGHSNFGILEFKDEDEHEWYWTPNRDVKNMFNG